MKITIENQFGERMEGEEIRRTAKYVEVIVQTTANGDETEPHKVRFNASTGRIVGFKFGFDTRRIVNQ